MRRNVVFERNRAFRPEDDRARPVHLGPRAGAAIGEYSNPEPNEYSDDYFGPADDYEARGYNDDFNPPHTGNAPAAGLVIHGQHPRPTATPTDSGHYGELHAGDQSWASLRRHMDRSAEARGSSHRGKGPKGYVRSDERIKEDIYDVLTDDHEIDASDVSVEVQDGHVTLTGNVEDRRMKFLIEDAVASCSGVQDVRNQLRTLRPR